MKKWNLLVPLLCLVAFGQEVNGLRCWRCSSDISNGEFCKDPFNPDLMSEYQRKWSYVDCVLPKSEILPAHLSQARPVCKKIIQQVDEKMVFARACSWEVAGAPSDACKFAHTPPNVRTLYCETCTTDGCNGDPKRSLSIFDPNKATEAPPSTANSLTIKGVSLLVVGLVAFLCRL